MDRVLTFSLFAALCLAPSVNGMDFATRGVQMLEKSFIDDCEADSSPYGYCGAYLQPCEFSFFKASFLPSMELTRSSEVCLDETSTLIAKPVPMHWFFNLTIERRLGKHRLGRAGLERNREEIDALA